MKKYIYTSSFLFLSFFASGQTLERFTTASAGGFISKSTLSLEYTIGETVISEFSTSSVVLNQGFNQSNNSTLSVSEIGSEISLKLFPNPSSNVLNVTSDIELQGSLTNLQGQSLGSVSFLPGTNTLGVDHLSTGVYLLTLRDSDGRAYNLRWIKE